MISGEEVLVVLIECVVSVDPVCFADVVGLIKFVWMVDLHECEEWVGLECF